MTHASSTATLFSAGVIGSVLLYQLVLHRLKNGKAKKRLLPTRRAREYAQRRKRIESVTDNIGIESSVAAVTAQPASPFAPLYDDLYFGAILQFLTTFEYLSTVCRLSQYHYLYLHHNHARYSQKHKLILYEMLRNESCMSWSLPQIAACLDQSHLLDVYRFMHHVTNNWKRAGCSKSVSHDRHSEIIQQLICLPYLVPNVYIVQHWFRYIGHKVRIDIRYLCFQSKSQTKPVRHGQTSLKHFFVSSDPKHVHGRQNEYELHLFAWIAVYNLYQLYLEINKKTMHDQNNLKMGEKSENLMNARNYFGVEHRVQRWLCYQHSFHFEATDVVALLKLFNMMRMAQTQQQSTGTLLKQLQLNAVFILCIMYKVILHNTELHIMKITQRKTWHEIPNIQALFLSSLSHVIVFTQYVVTQRTESMEAVPLLERFHFCLQKFKIVAMIRNILKWFTKSNKQQHVFHIPAHNVFCMDIEPSHFALFGLNHLHMEANGEIAICARAHQVK